MTKYPPGPLITPAVERLLKEREEEVAALRTEMEILRRARAKVAIKKAEAPQRGPYAEDGFAAARERREFADALGEAIEEQFAQEAAVAARRFKARKIIARARAILARPQPSNKRPDLIYKTRERRRDDDV